jgi:hypothetical protein
MTKNNRKKVSRLLVLFAIATLFTACTSTKHILKRTTEKVKVYKKSEVISLYDLSEYQSDIELDADLLMGFSFTEELKNRQETYSEVPIAPGERPLYFREVSVNIDLCKNWKETSYGEKPLEERAYGKNYSSFNPTQYKLFMSLKKLKKKKLVSREANEQEDICIYMDRKYYGHFGRFRDKSNKIHYKASEINNVRMELEKSEN